MTPAVFAVTRVDVWRVALPMVLSNITVPLIGVVDTAVMGRMPDAAYLGAVSAGATIYALVFFLFNFLRSGVTGFTAQAVGRADHGAIRVLWVRGLFLALMFGAVLIAAQPLIMTGGLSLLETSDRVHDLAWTYMQIRGWGAPLTLANMVVVGHLIGLQKAGLTLVHQVCVNLLNVAFNLGFVFGLGLDVDGVAWATVCAEMVGFGLGLFLVWRGLRQRQGRLDWHRVFEVSSFVAMMAVNRDIFIRTLLLQFCFWGFMSLGSRFGDTVFAANAVLLNLVMMAAYTSDAFAFAAESLSGQAVGAQSGAGLQRTVWLSMEPTLIFALVIAILYWVWGGIVIDIMTTLEAVQLEARRYLMWVALLPVLSAPAYVLDGVFLGATRGRDLRIAMLQSVALAAVSVVVLVGFWDNHGLWLALAVLNVARGAMLWRRLDRLLTDIHTMKKAPSRSLEPK